MTPAQAAEGRKWLNRWNSRITATPSSAPHGSALLNWLWAHREELVRFAELQSELITKLDDFEETVKGACDARELHDFGLEFVATMRCEIKGPQC